MKKYIISGGPGSGKTTLLEVLRINGFYTSAEVSRRLIQQLTTENSSLVPWKDLNGFAKLVLQEMVSDYLNANENDDLTFFDCAIPDIIGYLRLDNVSVENIFYKALEKYRYEPVVFMAPPWQNIYVNDTERWQTFAEASRIYDVLVETYSELGFQIIKLPLTPASARSEFIIDIIKRFE